jgi:ABC-2 type transport system ATP-binding protein
MTLGDDTIALRRVALTPSGAGEGAALEIAGALKRFGRENQEAGRTWFGAARKPKELMVAVDRVSLQVRRGEIFGLLGANGSGKSTLIRLVSTLLLLDGGTIQVFGHDVAREERQVRRLINRVSVEASFFKKLSALENLMYSARLYDLEPREARERAVEILGRLGLAKKRLYEPLENMSRGMQQKVAIARGLLTSPLLLLLDEPTTGLDPRSKHDVQRFVLEMRAEHDTTVFLTTHDMDEAERLCDRIAIIDGGKVVALDTPAGLCAAFAKPTLEAVFMHLTGKSLDDDEPGEED